MQAERDAAEAWDEARDSGDPEVLAQAYVDKMMLLGARGDLRAMVALAEEYV